MRLRGALVLVSWLALLGASSGLPAATFYVRPDGGDSSQCTGRVDAPYPGSGNARPCAWNHPFQALPPLRTPRIAGGDTLVIGSGSYRLGLGAPGAEACEASGAFDCFMPPVPSGLPASSSGPARPTRILGAGWDTGCRRPPELWGAERAHRLLDLTGASRVEVRCLELTDHSSCVEFHCHDPACPRPDLAVPCRRNDPPFGDWAAAGLFAAGGTRDVLLADLDIHGLASRGVLAGGMRDWTVERVRIVGNGAAGWDADVGPGVSDNAGALTFRHVEIGWNGCGETWPGEVPFGCWAQQTGGYGDGFATTDSGGDWLFEDVTAHHNTSDGIDLLYLRQADARVTLRRLVAFGNAGNQLKTAGPVELDTSLLVGNCGFFAGGGHPLMVAGDHCRALGTTFAADLRRGNRVRIVDSTLAGEGDCLFTAECTAGSCDGSERIEVRNSLFSGATDWGQPFELTCLAFWEDPKLSANLIDARASLAWNVKDGACFPAAGGNLCSDPLLSDADVDAFDGELLAGSPAVDRGSTADALPADLLGASRSLGSGPDVGAFERGGDTALRLGPGGRFQVTTRWRTAAGASGPGHARRLTADTGIFWFFDPANVELVLKVLDGCALTSRRWVFAGGLTDVEVTTVVRDLTTGALRTYRNPLGRPFQPLQDTGALSSCP